VWCKPYEPHLKDPETTVTGCLPDFKLCSCRPAFECEYPGMSFHQMAYGPLSTFLIIFTVACGAAPDVSEPSGRMLNPAAETRLDQSLETPQTWPHPDPAGLPDGEHKQQILYGEALIRRTFDFVGPDVADPDMRFAGNHLACGSCHLDAGRQRYGLSFIGVSDAYPRNMARENETRTLTQRINGCFERSMNGRVLPADSPEMDAMVAYMGFLSDAAPTGMDGRGVPSFSLLNRAADPIRGAEVYTTYCSVCHGDNGRGTPDPEGGSGYLYPPLWGPDSFNSGAGMHRIIKSANFIRANMPFGATFENPVLSEEEAFDVAAFINIQSRPIKVGLDRDYPDRSRKPVDAPFPPYDDGFSSEQHIFGPWGEMIEVRKERSGK
jgi:thiosulfate dehydrogenase